MANDNSDIEIVTGRRFDYDASQGGLAFSDPDGDLLTYELSAVGLVDGLTLTGASVGGTPTESGQVRVTITASDSEGESAANTFLITVTTNQAPVLERPNPIQFVATGVQLDYDVTQGGVTFFDGNDADLSYEIELLNDSRGLEIDGTKILGSFDSVGLVGIRVSATDPSGAVAEDEFAFVAPAPEEGEPNLSGSSFVYADAELQLPIAFTPASGSFPDTTPLDNPITNAGATLGRVLFYDKRLSITNTASCGSCHEQARGFARSERFSEGFQGELTTRNAMALSNVRFNHDDKYFWDMRAETLEGLALMPIENPIELGQPIPLLVAKLAEVDFYPPLFEAAFGTPEINSERIARALAQFLRSLMSYESRFDKAFHRIDGVPPIILSPIEIAGEAIFGNHCFKCHGRDAHVIVRPFNIGLDVVSADVGVSVDEPGRFRPPSLRNIEVSGPYMHDGRFSTLREVIDHYDSGVQVSETVSIILTQSVDGETVGQQLHFSEDDKNALEAFLRTLTDIEFLTDPKFSDPFRQ